MLYKEHCLWCINAHECYRMESAINGYDVRTQFVYFLRVKSIFVCLICEVCGTHCVCAYLFESNQMHIAKPI